MAEDFINDINVILKAERKITNSTPEPEEPDNTATSVLGVAVLGSMILGE